MKDFIIRKIKPERYDYFLFFKNNEYNSLQENIDIQENLLKEIIAYSIRNVPYYRRIAADGKIDLKGDIYEEIKKFPILTKEVIKNNFNNLKAINFKNNYWKNTSGGSTGEPVIFLQDGAFKEKGASSKILFEDWAGRSNAGDKLIKLWGSERDILEGTIGIKAKISNILNSRKLLNSFCMSEEKMNQYVSIINEYKPVIIEAYVQSIYELSKFIKNNNLKTHSPSGIIVSAGTFYPQMEKSIQGVFKCKILNRYGSREVGDMACSCKKNEGLHLNIFNHYIEILNDKFEECYPGEMGRVYVTTLHNRIMPLIRYDIGDIAIPAKNKKCSCGRGMPLIEKVVGRTVNVFKTADNKIIDGEYFTHLFYFKDWVSQFQVVQKSEKNILINLVLKSKIIEKDKRDIENGIRKVMGSSCRINWKFLKNIKPSNSGKFLYTISEIK